MSRLHEPSKCIAFYHHLQQVHATKQTSWQHSTDSAYDLTQLQFSFFQAPRTRNWHSNFKKKFISTTFTPLLRALKCHITPTGLVISGYVSIYVTLPSQPNQYAAFLAHSLKATSIPNYLNIIGILHKEFNLPYPLLGNWPLQYLLTDCLGLSGSKVCPLAQNNPLPLAFWVIFTCTSTCALVLMPPSGLYVW